MRTTVRTAVVAVTLVAGGALLHGQAGRQDTSTTARQGTTGVASDARTFVNDMAIAGMAEVELGKIASQRASNAEVKSFGQMMVKDHSAANDELEAIASKMKITMPSQLDQKHRDLVNRLSKLQGAEFDREYIMAMVDGHEEVASKLRARAKSGTTSTARSGSGGSTATGRSGSQGNTGDTARQGAGNEGNRAGSATTGDRPAATSGATDERELNEWASKTLPKVEQHLERARELAKNVK